MLKSSLIIPIIFPALFSWLFFQQAPPPTPLSAPTSTTTSAIAPVSSSMQWGAYVGDGVTNLPSFENLIGKKVNLLADFESWDASFPLRFKNIVGEQGKTLVVFWEPSFGYDTINNGSQDAYIKQFATGAKSYGYPVILSPFDEMNLNESAWGYGTNNNTAEKFITAWKHVHGIFVSVGATNVKFAIDYNNVPVPATSDNTFVDYYPGDPYVDYVAVDGFNYGNPWQSFSEVFDSAVAELSTFKKPMYILSTGTVSGDQKAAWIADMAVHVKKYPNVLGWVWFNASDSGSGANLMINTDSTSLGNFKKAIPQP